MRDAIRLIMQMTAACAAAEASGDLIVETGFEDSPPWQTVWVGPVAGSGGVFPSGGNPDGHFHGQLSVFESMSLGGFGAFDSTLSDIAAYQGGVVTLSIDYRFIDDQPQGLAPEIVPVILQSGRAYYPAQRMQADENEAWHSLDPVTYSLGSFINSTGIPIDFDSRVRIGVVGLLPNPAGGMPRTHFALDNVRIEIVPSPPAGAAVAALGLSFGARRRRRTAL